MGVGIGSLLWEPLRYGRLKINWWPAGKLSDSLLEISIHWNTYGYRLNIGGSWIYWIVDNWYIEEFTYNTVLVKHIIKSIKTFITHHILSMICT